MKKLFSFVLVFIMSVLLFINPVNADSKFNGSDSEVKYLIHELAYKYGIYNMEDLGNVYHTASIANKYNKEFSESGSNSVIIWDYSSKIDRKTRNLEKYKYTIADRDNIENSHIFKGFWASDSLNDKYNSLSIDVYLDTNSNEMSYEDLEKTANNYLKVFCDNFDDAVSVGTIENCSVVVNVTTQDNNTQVSKIVDTENTHTIKNHLKSYTIDYLEDTELDNHIKEIKKYALNVEQYSVNQFLTWINIAEHINKMNRDIAWEDKDGQLKKFFQISRSEGEMNIKIKEYVNTPFNNAHNTEDYYINQAQWLNEYYVNNCIVETHPLKADKITLTTSSQSSKYNKSVNFYY